MKTTTAARLSPAQQRMLQRLLRTKDHYELTPGGRRSSGREASAWHRTAYVLAQLGLVTMRSNGCNSVVTLTPAGMAMASGASQTSGGGAKAASVVVHATDPERPGRTACGHRTSTVPYVANTRPTCSTCRTIIAQRKRSGGGGAHVQPAKRIVRFAHDCPHCGAFASECRVEKANGSVLCARTGRTLKK
jgi:hypothetical protein